jgi:hypothetical protein
VSVCVFRFWSILIAADAASLPVLERLDPPRRAAVAMALLALVLTGLALVTCVMLGGHWVRRLARHRPGSQSSGTGSTSATENRRLRDSLHGMLRQTNTGETVHIDSSTNETKADE